MSAQRRLAREPPPVNDCRWLIDPFVLCGARIPEFGKKQKKIGYRVVIGINFTVEVARRPGMEGILLCKGINMIHSTIGNTPKLYHVQQEKPCQISQLSVPCRTSSAKAGRSSALKSRIPRLPF